MNNRHRFSKAETRRGQAALNAIQAQPWYRAKIAAQEALHDARCGLCDGLRADHATRFDERLGRNVGVCPPEAD